MSKRGENIRKRKDGRYEGRYAAGYKQNGTVRYRSIYAKTYAEVKKKLYQAVNQQHYNSNLFQKRLLVSQVSDMWMQNKKPYIKQSTYYRYQTVIRKHINSYFRDTRVDELDQVAIQRFTNELVQLLKPKTVRDVLAIFRQILCYAQEQALCGEVPMKVKLPKDDAGMVKIFSVTEQQKLVNYLRQEPDLQKLGVLICLYTGMRLGEICGLQWKDIDFTDCVIKVRRTVQRIGTEGGSTRFLIDTPKTQKSIRDIPISGFLMRELRKFWCCNPSAYVLTGRGEFTQPRTYQYRFKGYLQNSGLSGDFHFHTLRHTFATRAIELGFDPKTLSEILGHANVSITLNRYVHSSMELKRRSMDLFSVV